MKMRYYRSLLAWSWRHPAFATETITYTYDALGRVVTVVHTGTVNNMSKSPTLTTMRTTAQM